MKVIDLLNKIANDEIKLGTKFNWHYKLFDIELIFTERQGALGLYFQREDRLIGLFERFNYKILNDEVEIIEDTPNEDKKIKKIQSNGESLYSEYIGQWLVHKERYTEYDELLMNKINEIIEVINGE